MKPAPKLTRYVPDWTNSDANDNETGFEDEDIDELEPSDDELEALPKKKQKKNAHKEDESLEIEATTYIFIEQNLPQNNIKKDHLLFNIDLLYNEFLVKVEWDTGEDDQVPPGHFEYDESANGGSSVMAVHAQMIWAVNMAQGKATIDAPPNSVHFAKAIKLKVPKAAAPVISNFAPDLAPASVTPTPTLAPIPVSASSTNNLLLQHLLQNQQPNMLLNLLLQQSQPSINLSNFQNLLQLGGSGGFQGPVQPPTSTLPLSALPSPTKVLPHAILLTEFCTFYSVPADIQEKLKRLDIIPRDVKGIALLERQDWLGEAGFSKLESSTLIPIQYSWHVMHPQASNNAITGSSAT
ncbi:hypothetical protein PILCRDRAFT_86460 [Piloderma croceum F 1598]|uniref:Uncharacterized protein n=1 Tax=Piloderma croceum (strain F 1598) TaxID=765440 RepID=A0A0C3G860_PILCF|nr:hypothetical protein PILCRDRAFT_86460 [Piloderma croceum F 1598]